MQKYLPFLISKERISEKILPEAVIKNFVCPPECDPASPPQPPLRSRQSQASPRSGQTPSEYEAGCRELLRQRATGIQPTVAIHPYCTRTAKYRDFRQILRNYRYDVIVIGATLATAHNGAKTLLVEDSGMAGGCAACRC